VPPRLTLAIFSDGEPVVFSDALAENYPLDVEDELQSSYEADDGGRIWIDGTPAGSITHYAVTLDQPSPEAVRLVWAIARDGGFTVAAWDELPTPVEDPQIHGVRLQLDPPPRAVAVTTPQQREELPSGWPLPAELSSEADFVAFVETSAR